VNRLRACTVCLRANRGQWLRARIALPFSVARLPAYRVAGFRRRIRCLLYGIQHKLRTVRNAKTSKLQGLDDVGKCLLPLLVPQDFRSSDT
jgi:hypothetical protein